MKCQRCILKNKTHKKKIIIIGGSGRLGTNLIKYLNNDFNIINLSPEIGKIKTYKYIKFDLNKKSIDNFFKKFPNDIDCLINCARFRSSNLKENISDLEKTFDIEIKNYFYFVEKLINKNNTKKISILNISSTNAFLISQQFLSYHVSKNLLETLTRYLSIKYIKYNTKVNALRLGLISTKNLNKIVKSQVIKKFNLRTSAPNYKQISEFVKMNYVENALLNGTVINLDGSLTNIDQIYFNFSK